MPRRSHFFIVLLALLLFIPTAQAQLDLLRITRSYVHFVSDAPMERIEASTITATGVLDLSSRSFAVQVPVRDLDGFNSPLQREHFNENYMRSDRFPNAVFSGRVIESVDLTKDGEYTVRAKGPFVIQGVEKERVIECLVKVESGRVRITTTFPIRLADHEIRVPRIVQQKIAPEVIVDLDFVMEPAPRTRQTR